MCTECGERFNTVESFTDLGVPGTGSRRARVPRTITEAVGIDAVLGGPLEGNTPAPDPESGTEDWRTTFERNLRGGKDR
jgi:hypothetical protein